MSCGRTSLPRRNVAVSGLPVRCAQSTGQWPGSRRTFFEGRVDGERVEVVGVREVEGGASEREGGPRRVDAAEGGGRRLVEGIGAVLNVGGIGVGREVVVCWGFRFAVGLRRGGGGIMVLFGCSTDFA